MRIKLLCGSLRKDSYNKKILELVATFLQSLENIEVIKIDLNDYLVPLYNGDFEEASGIPEVIINLGKLITESDGIIIISPEYNGGISSPLKFIIDWVSRISPMPWSGKTYCLMGATTGGFGTIKSMMNIIQTLNQIKGVVYPESFSLSYAAKAFNADGNFVESSNQVRLEGTVQKFLTYLKDK
jgi:chromate reductase